MELPSPALVSALRELHLAGPKELKRAARHCRRLALDLPTFDSVWLDALVRIRRLTRFQACELQGGASDRLRRGEFVLIERLRADADATTYLARSLSDGRAVTLKELIVAPERQLPLKDELSNLAQAAAEVKSPHVIAPVEVIEANGGISIISRYVLSESARSVLIRHGRLEPAHVAEIGRQLLSGLEEAHRIGLPHGDIRIDNLRLTGRGDALLLDLGIRSILSPLLSIQEARPPEWYAGVAPERIGSAARSSAATDLYSLGCLLWHLLAGRPAFAIGDALNLLAAHRTRPVPDVRDFAPDTPEAVATAIREMTAMEPSDRPTSLPELQRRFRSTAKPALLRRGNPSLHRRRGSFPWAAAACLLFAASGTGFYLRDRGTVGTLLSAPFGDPHRPEMSGERIISSSLLPLPPPNPKGLIELEGPGPFDVADVAFRGPLVIRGRAERPATIVVRDRPLHLWADEVKLEHVNLVQRSAERLSLALVLVEAQHLTLRSCRFEATVGSKVQAPAAVAWRLVDRKDPTAGQIVVSDCVMSSFRDGLVLADTPRQVAASNVLGLGCRSLIAIKNPQRTMGISLERLTLRECDSVLLIEGMAHECLLEVTAIDSVLDLESAGSLVLNRTGGGSCRLAWRGSGVVTSTPVEAIRTTRVEPVSADEEDAEVEGVATAVVEFVGPSSGSDAASVARVSGVPRQAGHPAGIDLARLPRPPRPEIPR